MGIFPIGAGEALRHLLHALLETRVVALAVLRRFGLWRGAAGFGLELVAADDLRGGEQGAGGTVALLTHGDGHGFDDIGHADGVDLIARLQDLLLQVEENLGEAGALLGQGEDGLIDNLQAERGLHAVALGICDAEAYAGLVAGLIGGSVRGGFDLELVGGLHEDQAVVADGAGIAAEQVGAEIHRAGQLRRGGERQFRCAVGQVEIARQHGLPVLHHIDVRRAARFGGEDLQQNAVARAIHGAFRAQEDLLLALAKLQRHGGGGAVALGVAGIHVERRGIGGGAYAHHGDAAGVGVRALIGIARSADDEFGGRGRAIRVRCQHEHLILQVGNQGAALRNGGQHERILAHRDGLAARLGVAGRILHGGLNQHASGAMVQRKPGEIGGQREVELVDAIGIRPALRGAGIGHGDIHRRTLDGDLRAIHRLAEKVIGADGSGDVVAGTVAAPGVGVFAGELHRHFEFGQHVALHVESDLGGIGSAAGAGIHQCPDVIGAQVDFVGESELGGRHTVLVGLVDFLEDLIAA